MSEDIVVRLRDGFDRNLRHAAIDTIEALRGEVEILKTQRDEYLQFWKNNVEACEEAEAEVARLKAALEEIKRLSRLEDSVRMSAINQLADKALGGDE